MKLRQLLREGERRLREAGTQDAAFDAFRLLLLSSGGDHTWFVLKQNEEADGDTEQKFFSLIDRRKNREPLQYIEGSWDFYNSVLSVGSGVFIPRAETEELAELCVKQMREGGGKIVYDLCSGSGCIGLSIAAACPETTCFLFEYIDEALVYTEKNAKESGLKNVTVVKCDVLSGPSDKKIPSPDLIVSNPPYIITDEIADLPGELHFEPVSAFDGGSDGLVFYKALADLWLPKLNNGGFAAVECGENQGTDIVGIFGRYLNCDVISDVFGVGRFVAGVKR